MYNTMFMGALYNIGFAIVALLLFRLILRWLNKQNGYTLQQFFTDAKAAKQYNAIAIVFGFYALAGAVLISNVIS